MPPPDFDSIWSPAKVFTPTPARQASLQQKDWAYVDQFLVSRFAPAPVPKFERNPDTLKALLAIASANEAADEEKLLERRVKERALEELKKLEADTEAARVGEPLLTAVEEHLTEEGRRRLNSVALLSVALASATTDAGRLASQLIELSKQEFAVEQQTQRINSLYQRLQSDLESLRDSLRKLETGEEHRLPPNLSQRVTEWTRTSRHLRNKTEDYKERLETMEAEFNSSRVAEGITVPALLQQEQEVLALKERVLDLEAQARGYQGLPPEKDLARLEVERAQQELRSLEARREELYDSMLVS